MKLTIKLLLIISLFCSTAFADGDMDEGGLVCNECVITTKVENKDVDKTRQDKVEVENPFMIFIRDIFSKMLG